MSHGKPVIAPRLGCIPEVLGEEGGFLFDPRDGDGLGHAPYRGALATPRADLHAMGALNRSVCDGLDWDGIARQLVAVYRS